MRLEEAGACGGFERRVLELAGIVEAPRKVCRIRGEHDLLDAICGAGMRMCLGALSGLRIRGKEYTVTSSSAGLSISGGTKAGVKTDMN